MNLLFWNLSKNGNERLIKDIIFENSIDFSIFAEYHSTDFTNVVSELGNDYCLYRGYGGCDKVIMLAHKDIEVFIRREQNRYALYSCNVDGCLYIIAGIHLPANPGADADQRKNVIRELVQDINELEGRLKSNNTIVIGDFNASPFDSELIQKDAFNAVLYKELILKTEYVTIGGKRYRRFYNPIVNSISEDSTNYGSLYYGSGINSLYWFCYDQVIVRKPLANSITNVKYCRTINNRSLLNKFVPNKSISDHLPLIMHIERMISHD